MVRRKNYGPFSPTDRSGLIFKTLIFVILSVVLVLLKIPTLVHAKTALSLFIILAESFQDWTQLLQLLTYEAVEEAIKKRVEIKARIFSQDITINNP
ncbi:hypothetical protein YC2023_022844 [Brassica napus]